ncbi:MAG TPA: sulfotransferase family protein [Deltaproteobacteria bacterium]|nr:sulfotransferase family protein [Deltaproteobacteria bacterium]
MMRSWESRHDTTVVDEPLYAAWMVATGAQHPMREAILQHHESRWEQVVAQLQGPVGTPILYEKHISKHLCAHMDRAWLASHRHAFLIRDPWPMLLSFQRKVEQVTVAETGLPQQAELWHWLHENLGIDAPVIDARDLLTDPSAMLPKMTAALGVPFDPAMLQWEAGRRPTDGVWASHWYDAVEQSTGFRAYTPSTGALSRELEAVHDACLPAYQFLHARRLRPVPSIC